MSVTEFMQPRVTVDDVAIDPGIFAFGARLDYRRKRLVNVISKGFLRASRRNACGT